jgi:hypothetical protein
VAETIYGRDRLVEVLAHAEAPLTLLTGDSGIGKTSVLEAAAAMGPASFRAPPRRLAPSAGAVQQGVLDALADVVAAIIEKRGTAAEMGDRLAGAAERVLKENAKELGRAIGAELLEVVRSRLGPQFGNALVQYIRKLREETDESLVVRLAAARDESTAEVLAAFCSEVAEEAGTAIALSFDTGERLKDDELRILADLAERVRGLCYLRLAFATDSGPATARVAELRRWVPEIHEIEVRPLDEKAVTSWLADADIDAPAEAAIKATGGYPLHLADLIHDLKQGGRIEDLPLNEQVVRRSEAAWQALSPQARSVARRLCVLDDPLSEERLRRLVELDVGGFAEVTDELARGRVFPVSVNGRPWFHEQRRAFVRHKLHPDELDQAATKAAEAVWEEALDRDERRLLVQFANLAAESTTLQRKDRKLAAALAVDEPQHAVLAAALELTTPENRGGAEADGLFRHARRFTDLPISPLAILSALEEAGLVVTASNEHSTIVVPSMTPHAVAVIDGLADRRLKRGPILQVSALVFDTAVRPRLGSFAQAHFGIGRPSLGSLARVAGGGDPEAGYGRSSPNRRDPGIHILARARFGDLPLWLVATYEDEAARTQAQGELTGFAIDVFDSQLQFGDLFEHPLHVVPEQRFAKAAARAAGLTVFQVPETRDIKIALDDPPAADQLYELRVETAKRLRTLATGLEREAMELDEPFGLYWDKDRGSSIECTVYGSEERAVRVNGLLSTHRDQRYLFFEIEQALRLPPGAALRNVQMRSGVASSWVDPVFAEISKRRNRAVAFNSAQPRRRVVVDAETLQRMTRDGFLRLMADARALSGLMLHEPSPLPPTALYVYVLVESPTSGFVPACGSRVIALERESESGEDDVHFALGQGGVDLSGLLPLATGDVVAMFAEAFGFPPSNDVSGFLAGGPAHDVDSLLSEYAGFHESDLSLRWPGED